LELYVGSLYLVAVLVLNLLFVLKDKLLGSDGELDCSLGVVRVGLDDVVQPYGLSVDGELVLFVFFLYLSVDGDSCRR
jgi:hypothetical protein